MTAAAQNKTGPPFPRIAWIRAAEQDRRLTGGPLDLAKVMGVAADSRGRCDLTIRQIQERMVLRRQDGSFFPERTIKDWRTRLKGLGKMTNVRPSASTGFAGPGKGHGGVWQLLMESQNGSLETGENGGDTASESRARKTGRWIAPSTSKAHRPVAKDRETPGRRHTRTGAIAKTLQGQSPYNRERRRPHTTMSKSKTRALEENWCYQQRALDFF